MSSSVLNHFRAVAYGWKWLLRSGSLHFRQPVARESVAKWKWSMLISLWTQFLGQAEEIIHFPRFYSEKQYFPRFSTRYSIESTISCGRFLPILPLLSSGSRFLSCWATFGCCELHRLSRSSHNSITSYWEWLRFRLQIPWLAARYGWLDTVLATLWLWPSEASAFLRGRWGKVSSLKWFARRRITIKPFRHSPNLSYWPYIVFIDLKEAIYTNGSFIKDS
jgi:hypothetical protein